MRPWTPSPPPMHHPTPSVTDVYRYGGNLILTKNVVEFSEDLLVKMMACEEDSTSPFFIHFTLVLYSP